MSFHVLSKLEVDALMATLAASAPPRVPFKLTGTITIDASGTTLLDAFRQRHTTAASHSTHTIALDNVASPTPRRGAIVGHGEIGAIFTGSGATKREQDKSSYLGRDNIDVWSVSVGTLTGQGISSLTLCSCLTGAESSGARLLVELSKKFNCDVCAPTGWVRASTNPDEDPYIEDGKWRRQIAGQPEAAPSPAPAIPVDRAPESIVLLSDGRFLKAPLTAISAARLVDADNQVLLATHSWPEQLVPLVATFAEFDRPRLNRDPLAAAITGRLTLSFDGDEWDFLVYNDRLLEDAREPGTFYAFDAARLLIWAASL